ncbi:MAG: holo-ACP synthase [Clostridia bacterium]|nr:holo-ACP synthase [Clostridia bacterium]
MKIINGTDIVEIYRIKRDIETLGDKFLSRIYTENEIKYCESKKLQKYQSYAARFAAKEAIYKALSDYIDFEYSWRDFEILNDETGKPYVKLGIKIKDLENLSITLSHCKEYAVANAIAIYK